MDEKLTQTDFEELSAYMDGELTGPALSRVLGMLQTSPSWQRALQQLRAVERAMDAYVAPPAPDGLAQRVLRRTSHAHRVVLLPKAPLRWLAPLAAAAAIVAALLVFHAVQRPVRPKGPLVKNPYKALPSPSPQAKDQAPGLEEEEDYPDLAGVDRFAEDNLDFLRDMGVVDNLDTIEAIYNQQVRGGGT